jgi:hypothetical protein
MLGALTVIAAGVLPAATAAREPGQVHVQRSRATLAMGDRQADGFGRTSRDHQNSVIVTRSRGVRVMRGSAQQPAENTPGVIDDGPALWAAANTMIRPRDYPALYLPAPDKWPRYPVGLAGRYAALAVRTDYALARLRKLRRPMLQGAAYPAFPQAWTVHRGQAYGNVAGSLEPTLSAR